MKRWRNNGAIGHGLVAAALAMVFLGSSPHALGSEKTPDASTFSRAALDRIGDYVRNEISTGKIPGAVLLIQQHGKLVDLECFGVRDPASKQPMTPDSIFQIYSMSKAVTSVAAMMLVEDGKLSLDDPVSKYIHSFADAKVGVDLSDEAGKYPLKLEPLKRPITIRDLLRHTSGITYGFFGETQVQKLYADPKLYAGDYDNAEFADRIASLPLADQPGVRWNYSHSTDVLGRVVEVASGQSLFQFEKQRLFDPLGMSETAYYVADKAKWPRIAQAYPVDRFRVAGIKDATEARRWESGGAGLVSTAGDYARFLQMLLNGGELDGKRYLKPETVALMTSDQIGPETGIIHDPFYFPGPGSGFGLGFAIRTAPPPNTTWPLGEYRWDGAGGSFYFVDPVDDLLVVFMVQAPTQGGRIQLALKTIMYEALGKGLRKD
ncbi:serine hydrolase domain-containing protein [Bradyrhizobium sp. BWA-3-5]|uniref:serine hydrolase domain-containing protein n=1 Tax=Bradyrhizobium sp. BWA-3-5 TaxID=3080013 RepID=UPI00293E57ED|nr:serine hydrolase domain-containing protein [Bradyrhizobium sp. BWA-3-5]WOH68753.1 serine hydrolase domain-containing protein [Bradyrhizobium sp. BWA-3-5]